MRPGTDLVEVLLRRSWTTWRGWLRWGRLSICTRMHTHVSGSPDRGGDGDAQESKQQQAKVASASVFKDGLYRGREDLRGGASPRSSLGAAGSS